MPLHLQNDQDWRTREFKYDKFIFSVAIRFLAMLFLLLAGFALFPADLGYFVNLYTDIVVVIGTVFIIDAIATNREEKRDIKRRQDDLIRQLRSKDNDTVLIAIEALRDEGWLPYILEGKNLTGGNFQNANLYKVSFKGTTLDRTNFKETNLAGACFDDSSLIMTDLTGTILQQGSSQGMVRASFRRANLNRVIVKETSLNGLDFEEANLQTDLHETTLSGCNLSGANLTGANLQGVYLNNSVLRHALMFGTDLSGAVLTNADLANCKLDFRRAIFYPSAVFSSETVLPDGTKYIEGKELDQLARFTDPQYQGIEGFWKSEHPEWRIYASTYKPQDDM